MAIRQMDVNDYLVSVEVDEAMSFNDGVSLATYGQCAAGNVQPCTSSGGFVNGGSEVERC